jgi:hypothetical protein
MNIMFEGQNIILSLLSVFAPMLFIFFGWLLVVVQK